MKAGPDSYSSFGDDAGPHSGPWKGTLQLQLSTVTVSVMVTLRHQKQLSSEHSL